MHFSECLVHAGLAVLSERTRFALFVDCTPVGIDTRKGWRPDSVGAGTAGEWGAGEPVSRGQGSGGQGAPMGVALPRAMNTVGRL